MCTERSIKCNMDIHCSNLFSYFIKQQAWYSKECIPCIALFILAACNLIWTGMLLKLPFKSSKEVCDEYEAIIVRKQK